MGYLHSVLSRELIPSAGAILPIALRRARVQRRIASCNRNSARRRAQAPPRNKGAGKISKGRKSEQQRNCEGSAKHQGEVLASGDAGGVPSGRVKPPIRKALCGK